MKINLLVEGGKATPGPPLGPALGPIGVDIPKIVQRINELTKDFEGIKVPVKIEIDEATKKFEIEVGTPPASALILKEIGMEKGSKTKETIANLTMKQVKKIADTKTVLLGNTLKDRVREIVGTCVSMGIKVDEKDPRETQQLIKDGKYDDVLKG